MRRARPKHIKPHQTKPNRTDPTRTKPNLHSTKGMHSIQTNSTQPGRNHFVGHRTAPFCPTFSAFTPSTCIRCPPCLHLIRPNLIRTSSQPQHPNLIRTSFQYHPTSSQAHPTSSGPHPNLIRNSSEPHRNLIRTSSQPHPNRGVGKVGNLACWSAELYFPP
eukprot:gene10526-biopygen6288